MTASIYRTWRPLRASQKRVVELHFEFWICAPMMLGEKVCKLFIDNVHSIQIILQICLLYFKQTCAKDSHVLTVFVSCILAVITCWSLVEMSRCHLDVMLRCHMLMSRALFPRNTLWSILWRSFPLYSSMGRKNAQGFCWFYSIKSSKAHV